MEAREGSELRRRARAMSAEFRELTATLYQAVSAAPGERDWDAVRRIYHPEARLVRTGVDPGGSPFAKVMSLDAYLENIEALLAEIRFSEVEIGHEACIYGNVARITSVYEFTWESPGNAGRAAESISSRSSGRTAAGK